jgi:hypothetical protein
MTDDLSDDEDQMQLGRGGGMDDEDDDLEIELDPTRGGGNVHQREDIRGRKNGVNGQRQKRQQAQQRAPYDDDENF